MVHYNISFDFTDPKNLQDVNHMKHLKDLTKAEKDAWVYDILVAAFNGSWLISGVTIECFHTKTFDEHLREILTPEEYETHKLICQLNEQQYFPTEEDVNLY